jgi:hypothetical protein
MPQPQKPNLAAPRYSVLAGFLSYLVPGLGQIVQGRIGKGILFFVCLYGLFFYGMYLGSWSNVYLPDVSAAEPPSRIPTLVSNVWARLPFAGQFWIGVAAWPAIWQYNTYDPAKNPDLPPKDDANTGMGRLLAGIRTFERAPYENRAPADRGPRMGEAPADWPHKTLNELQIEGDKTWDLGWVFTVIAGVLNILVIYDAFAGPAFGNAEQAKTPAPLEAAA